MSVVCPVGPRSFPPSARARPCFSRRQSTLFFEEFRWPATLQAIYAPNEPIFCCFPQFCLFPDSHLSCCLSVHSVPFPSSLSLCTVSVAGGRLILIEMAT